jgi:16S rRNA G966 N2-methylase RsmD
VLRRDVLRALADEHRRYDLVLCDPPYDLDVAAALAPQLARILAPDGLVVYQTASRVTPSLAGLVVSTSRRYGATRLTLLGH